MRFSSAITFPHPVLRPPGVSDDYPNSTFEIANRDEMLKVDDSKTGAQISCELRTDDSLMLSLIEEGKACYGLEVSCTRTLFRETFLSKSSLIEKEIPPGSFYGKVQMSPHIVASENIPDFQSKNNWHKDFLGASFNIEKGTLLAADEPFSYTAGITEENEMSAIFKVEEDRDIEKGFRVFVDSEKIAIRMSPESKSRYDKIEEEATRTTSAYFIITGLFQHALAEAISIARNPEDEESEYSELRWYLSIDNKLTEKGMPTLEKVTNCFPSEEAQKLFEEPFEGFLDACEERILA